MMCGSKQWQKNTSLEAAKIIGVTDRMMRQSSEHFDTSGYKSPVDQRKAKPSERAVGLFQRAIALGFDTFTFGLKAQIRNMDQADTLRVNGAGGGRSTSCFRSMRHTCAPVRTQHAS
jgi:hypothetical protein